MPRLRVRPLVASDVRPAAALIAARQAALRAQRPELAERFEQSAPAIAALDAVIGARGTAAVAEDSGQLAGFAAGVFDLHAPDHFVAQYNESHATDIPVEAHAVAPGADATAVYAALYGALADAWIDRGYFVHRVALLDGDAAAQDAWAQLGFGPRISLAWRDTRPPDPAPNPARLEIRRATPEDVAVVSRFADLNARHHRAAPILWPYLAADVSESVRDFERRALADEQNAAFLAFAEGAPVGMHLLLRGPGFGPALATPERAVYLYEAVTTPDQRGTGVGAALLDRSLAWAREEGYSAVTLHYATANPSGRPFWLKHGFRPLEHTWTRRIDERVAWARVPTDEEEGP